MIRKFIFKYKEDMEWALPVTPEGFSISYGNKVELIDIHNLGDVSVCGGKTLATIQIGCLLPRQNYSFSSSKDTDPYNDVATIKSWIDEKAVLRFIVSDTGINLPVLITSISYGENDGTNDIYATLVLQEYREVKAETEYTAATGNNPREGDSQPVKSDSYPVVKGDTLSAICKDRYGKASLYPKVAAYNKIKNPNLIFIGQTIKLPDESQL